MYIKHDATIYVRIKFTDMRKQWYGLASLAEEAGEDPTNGDVFVFCGKTKKTIKILYWRKNGFCLWSKRLEEDRFPWPSFGVDGFTNLDRKQLSMILRGVDIWNAHKEIKYARVT